MDKSGSDVSLEDDDISDMGNLLQGLETSDISRLSADAIQNNMYSMQALPLDNDVAETLVTKAKEKIRFVKYLFHSPMNQYKKS